MKKLLFFAFVLINIPTTSQQPYWQQQVNYTIDVTLNDIEHTLDGFLRLQYTNNSPDSLFFIWFHLWPNAFKNDRTPFSEQLLQNRRTDFYFSDKEQKGYMNRLDFRIDNLTLEVEDHPQFIDVIKVILPKPLLTGEQVEISTPFHVKLPHNFSRGGHIGQSYQITQWYPKPAVYDRKGWHPMTYLDQGEFYSEFGDFDVRITLPKNYVVAATGELQSENEKRWLKDNAAGRLHFEIMPTEVRSQKSGARREATDIRATETKTIQYVQNNVHDFAWFADKRFMVKMDTIQLGSGKIVDAWSFNLPEGITLWENSIKNIKDAIHFRSAVIGEYPYNIVSAVQGPSINPNMPGGMEYPTITMLRDIQSKKMLDYILEHEIGHNWFYGILASNERIHPWMDEGMNSYYDNRYMIMKYGSTSIDLTGLSRNQKIQSKLPEDEFEFLVDWITTIKKDQPINTPSEDFSFINYNLIAYTKAATWMKQLESSIGTTLFDSCMREYFNTWKFKHPYPEDFRDVIEKISGKNLSENFELLDKKGFLTSRVQPKKIKPTFLFSFRNTDSITYINIAPAFKNNKYDKFMLGILVHNYAPPPTKFRFVLAPLFAFRSKQLNGAGKLSYTLRSDDRFEKIAFGLSGSRFSTMAGIDSNNNKIFGGFHKIVPGLRFTFNNRTARSSLEKWIEWKTYLIGEKGFDYNMKSTDSIFYPAEASLQNRYLNQLTFNLTDSRILYPYDLQFQLQQGSGFYRANGTANYFFNYSKGGGVNVRFFVAKFGYIGTKTSSKEFETSRYQPKLTAVRGYEDYTYSNDFFGRNEVDGLASQQIMMRDGDLKLRTDLFQGLQGRSDDWVASMNFNTTLPNKMFPVKLPVRIFFDVGTYAEAWEKDASTSRFLYVTGLQVSLFKELINIYAPIFFSSEFRDNLKTVPEENKFFRRISFSIDIQRINLRRIGNQLPL